MNNKNNFKINKKSKFSLDDLQKFTKNELMEKVVQLQAHNLQLKNIIEKSNQNEIEEKSSKRKFNFSNSPKRHVLLKVLYLGWNYQGFANQEDTTSTIEYYLFKALKKTCLIQSRETSNYNRCGRTDKEVSAFCQVISIDLRSKFDEEEQKIQGNTQKEIDYCGILNRVLPKNIKCISWKPLSQKTYSARFDCLERTYKYFFPKGNLDIEAMRLGCKNLIGTHDFRNLCKMDVGNGVVDFIRSISFADIHICQSETDKLSGYAMYYLKVTGKAFLWHQIRCIMAILILIGEHNEEPNIISELLNVKKNPCKPQYNLVKGTPLNLYECSFRPTDSDMKNYDISNLEIKTIDEENNKQMDNETDWLLTKENLSRLIKDMQIEWSENSIRKTMIREMLCDLEQTYCKTFGTEKMSFQTNMLQQGVKSKMYQNLMCRKRCESLENRVNHYVKKQRLLPTIEHIKN